MDCVVCTTPLLRLRQHLSQISKHIKHNVADVHKLFHMKKDKALFMKRFSECKSYVKTFLRKLSRLIHLDGLCKNEFLRDLHRNLFCLRFVNEAERTKATESNL